MTGEEGTKGDHAREESGGAIIALDYGRRRVGIAGCSGDVSIAFGIDTLKVSGLDDLLDQLEPILHQRGVRKVVLGFPVTLGDRPGSLKEEILELAGRLRDRDMTIHLVDEALSSQRASSMLQKRGRHPRKEDRDRASAAIILQDFLDGRLPPLTLKDIEQLQSRPDHK